ncbi:phenazine biosynthesis protein PhzF family protein [Plectosphaerella plurivora]|uniref:Phenazine biosynthesis protein PhzF family protein n=1 Tax=Plectosphaerella plurivora TaxID=936078 RepID=A0A9P8VC24_9PEZI|nr:phenazine biosynthesis protein PhzF family protein [Plectosphaerella plurivora]
MSESHLISVFTAPGNEARGGNPCPVVLGAEALSTDDMRSIAEKYGHESSFLTSPPPGSNTDYELRFFVPEHEMEMCGHATAGTTWLLNDLGRLKDDKTVTYHTKSGLVRARMVDGGEGRGQVAEVSQPRGWVKAVEDESIRKEILEVLHIKEGDLHLGVPIQNACTSRAKTMIRLKDATTLNRVTPDFSRVKALCEKLDSTGLYPYAVLENGAEGVGTHVEARQFPKSSGYPEDAATGIAAAALSWAIFENGMLKDGTLVVRQGVAMGRPSEIRVRVEEDGCWIGGSAQRMEAP